MRRIQLLLADEQNAYQRLLVNEARSAAERHGIELLPPQFAEGSVMRQMGQCYGVLRKDPRADGVVLLLVATDEMGSPVEALAKDGVDLVVLNRIPGYLDRLSELYSERLLASVTPDQEEIGRIQGQQSLRLLPEDGSVLLISGARNTPSAVSREEGFRQVVGDRLGIRLIEGHWQAARAEKALGDWLRFNVRSGTSLDLIVCQNDAMARGAREALKRHASEKDASELTEIPILGCDGLPNEGAEMVRRGELAATVVMPPSSPRAVEVLDAFWRQGEVLDRETLLPSSLPPLEKLQPIHRA